LPLVRVEAVKGTFADQRSIVQRGLHTSVVGLLSLCSCSTPRASPPALHQPAPGLSR